MDNFTATYLCWWNRRTELEKSLIITIFVLFLTSFLICVAQFVVMTFPYEDFQSSTGQCNSTVCIYSASIILNRINSSVNPCDDFYEFACGNYLTQTDVPVFEENLDFGRIIDNKVDMQLVELLDSTQNGTGAFLKAQKLFWSCTNETQIKKRGFEPIHQIFKWIGGWPILEGDKWNENAFDWIEALKKLKQIHIHQKYFISIFFKFEHLWLYENVGQNFPRHFRYEPMTSNDYQTIGELMAKYVEILNGDTNSQSVKDDIVDFLNFLKSLKEITQLPFAGSKYFSIAEIQEKYQNIRWLELINITGPSRYVYNYKGALTTDSNNLEALSKLLGQTSKRTIANYITFSTLHSYINQINIIPNDLYEAKLSFEPSTGKHEDPPRWQTCIREVKQCFFPALLSRYNKKYFTEEGLNELDKIKEHVQATVLEISAQLAESTNDTFLMEYFKNNTKFRNIPKEFLSDSFVDNLYEKIDVDEKFYFESQLHVLSELKFEIRNYYLFLGNNAYGPLPMLMQDLIFKSERPIGINFAGVGFRLGTVQKRPDLDYTKYLIASEQTNQCFEEQLESYKDSHKMTKRIKDFYIKHIVKESSLAVHIAYSAYMKWMKDEHKSDLALYGVPYNAKQLFWINSVQVFCAKSNVVDYTSYKYGVIESLINSIKFAQDFHCPVGSHMNPKQKCQCLPGVDC